MDAEKIDLMMRMLPDGVSRRDFLRTAAAGAAGAAGHARRARSAARAQTPKKGGTLVYGMEGPSDILDPQATGCWLTYRVTFQMFEGLLAEDLTQADVAIPKVIPKLAESYTLSKDGLSRTFKLRKGVKFHDGTPFNAARPRSSPGSACARRTRPHFYPRANSYTYYVVEYITGVEAVDEYTLKLTFSKPYAEWERMTLQSWGEPMMVSPTQVKKTGNEKFADAPVGTGPFKFVENVPGDRIVLERFKDYWGPQANVDKLVFRRLDDPAARVAALRTGEVDFILAPPPDEVEALRKDKFQVLQSQRAAHLVLAPEHEGRELQGRAGAQGAPDGGRQGQDVQGAAARHREAGVEHDLARHRRLRPQVQALLLRPREGQGAAEGRGARQRLRDHLLDLDVGLGPDDPGGDGGVDPARPRQGGHPGQARDLRLDHLSLEDVPGAAPGPRRLPALLGHDQQLLDRHRGPLHAPARQGRERRLVREPEGRRPPRHARAASSTRRSAPRSTSRSTGSSWRRTPRSSPSATTSTWWC